MRDILTWMPWSIRVSSVLRHSIVILLLALAILSAFPAQGKAKNYYFPEVRVDIAIEPDGSFTVDEFRTYEFEGSFSWASLWIPLRVVRQGTRYEIKVEDFELSDENGHRLAAEIGKSLDKVEVKWRFQAKDERRTFHFHYRVRGAIISYPDVSELYWQAIGDDWDRPTGKVVVTVTLPEPVAKKDDLLIYGHGPLSGWFEIVDSRRARFVSTDVRAFQFVEIRLVWPAGLVAGVPSRRHTRESIREEEARFVKETIARIEREQEKAIRRHAIAMKVLLVWAIGTVVLSLGWLFIFVRAWRKVGKDYRFEDIPDYFRDLPSDLPPALVEVLLREGKKVTPRSFTATLFDLARKGYVELEEKRTQKEGLFRDKEDVETTITLRKKDYAADSRLLGYEKNLLDFLFMTVGRQKDAGTAGVRFGEIEAFLKEKPQKFQEWYTGWAKKIDREAKNRHFIEPKSLKTRNLFLAATIPVAVLTLNPILGLLAGLLLPKMKRRSQPWARENELWKALDRFLDDFSSFQDLPPESYKLWEHYLVFGILFGNARKILKMLPLILKDERATIPVWYRGLDRSTLASPSHLASIIKNIESASTSLHRAATSAVHYSSGGGGGFSRGGGGGAGGGGGRAG